MISGEMLKDLQNWEKIETAFYNKKLSHNRGIRQYHQSHL